jgi:hypothetical protein
MSLKTLLPRVLHRPVLVLALLPTLFIPALARAAEVPAPPVSLSWSPNPESDVAGYKIYFGTVSGDYPTVQDVGDVTSAALPPMILGRTYYVALRAYDTGAREGPLSAELVVTASPPAPVASTGFAAGPSGQGALEWKYPKTASSQADRFTIQSSEDLLRWVDAGGVTPAEASRSDSEWLYFSVPFATDKPRQFFRVAAANPFGESP